MDPLKKIKEILFKPNYFFTHLDKEKGIKDSFIYLVILTIFYTVMIAIIVSKWPTSYVSLIPLPEITNSILIFLVIISLLGTIIGSFITAALLHVWLIIFNAKKTYSDTYKLYVYSITPKLIFGWIPIVNLLAWVYSLILIIIGTNKMYKISKFRATMIYVIPLIVLVLIFILLFFLLASLLVVYENQGGF